MVMMEVQHLLQEIFIKNLIRKKRQNSCRPLHHFFRKGLNFFYIPTNKIGPNLHNSIRVSKVPLTYHHRVIRRKVWRNVK